MEKKNNWGLKLGFTVMDWLIQYAWTLAARTHRYHYGGDDPIQGFDCSGYVEEILLAAGEIPFGTPKLNAQALYNLYEHSSRSAWSPGSLSFYGADALHIVHVGFCLNDRLMLEAAGGDSTTTTDDEAIKRNAFIKMRPIQYRKDFFCVLRPSYAKLGLV